MKSKCCNTRHIHVIDKRTICINPGCERYLDVTEAVREWKTVKYLVVTGLFIFSVLFTFEDYSKSDENLSTELIGLLQPESTPLNLETLEAELINQQILCAGEVLAQIRLETGNLNSALLKRTNNLMGMRFPYRRSTTAVGIYLPQTDTIIIGSSKELARYAKTNHYAAYATWQDAVADYKLWQDAHFKMTDRYLEFLGKVYAEDSLYVKKIRQMSSSALAAKKKAEQENMALAVLN